MAQQTKSTHRAHCQVCGRLQAVIATTGRIAKHGYTVKGWGFFHGTCTGSDYPPLQKERDLTDSICRALTEHAAENDRAAEAFRTGKQIPLMVRGQRKGKDYERISWVDATPLQQRDEVNRLVWSCENAARAARAHVEYMKKLAEQVHGTDLLPIVKVERVAPVLPTVDTKAGTVSGTYPTKAARQADLDKLSKRYEAARKVLSDLYLRSGEGRREDKEATALYYGAMYLHEWRPKHSALALKLYGDAAREVVQQIEELVRAREAVKNA